MTRTIGKLVQLDRAIEEGSKNSYKSPWGALVGFFFKEVIVLRFKWKITTPAKGRPMWKEKRLYLRLVWSYDIMSLLFDTNLVGFDLLDIEFHLTGPYTLSKIHEMLANIIKENVENIGQAIPDRPEDFAKLISVVALDRLGLKVIGSLLCR